MISLIRLIRQFYEYESGLMKKTFITVLAFVIAAAVPFVTGCEDKTAQTSLQETTQTTESEPERADISYDDLIHILYDSMGDEFFYWEYVDYHKDDIEQQQKKFDNAENREQGIIRIQEIGEDLGDDRYCSFTLIEYDMSSETYRNMYVGDEIKVHARGESYDPGYGKGKYSTDYEYVVTAIYGQYVLCLYDVKGYSSTSSSPFFTDAGNAVYYVFSYLANGGAPDDPLPIEGDPEYEPERIFYRYIDNPERAVQEIESAYVSADH